MRTFPKIDPDTITRRLSAATAVIVLVVAGLVMLGWAFDIGQLKSLRSDWVTMKVNTALCFALSGFSLWCFSRDPGSLTIRLARVSAMAVVLIGLASVMEIVFDWDMKIDQLLFRDPVDAVFTLRPGLMALNTAVSFMFTGLTLLLAGGITEGEKPGKARVLGWQTLILLVGVMAFLSCAGYLYGVTTFAGVPRYLRMAVHTAGAFLLLSIGILCLKPKDGVMALITADAPGSQMLRYLALPIIVIPFFFFWLRILGEQRKLYDYIFGTSLMMVGSSIILLGFLATTAYWLNRSDAERRLALEQLSRERALFKNLIQTIPDLVWLKDPGGVYLTCNPRFERFFGAKEAAIVGKTDYDFMPADLAGFFRGKDKEAIAADSSRVNEEWVTYADDGHRELLETIKTPMRDDQGNLIGVLGIARDITAVRENEKRLSVALREWDVTFDSITDSICVFDAGHHVLRCNRSMKLMFGAADKGYCGAVCHEVVHGTEEPVAGCPYEKARCSLRREVSEFQSGSSWFEVTVDPILDETGSFAGAVHVVRDITIFKQAQQELLLHRNRLRSMLDLMDDGVYIINRDCRIEYVNPAFEKLFGEVAGRLCYEYFHGIDAPCPWCVRDEVFAGKTVKWEHHFSCVDRICEVFDTPFLNEDGSYSMLGVVHDITEHKEAQRKLQEAQAQVIQQEKLATIGQLAAGVAHEINNPVGFVRSNLISLGKYVDKFTAFINYERNLNLRHLPEPVLAEAEEFWQKAKLDFVVRDAPELLAESIEGTDRIKRIVQDLMSFSRRNGEDMAPVDLNECLQSTVTLAWNEIKHVAELKLELGDIPQVMGNRQKLSQVFLNLLVNAAHAMEKQGVITIASRAMDDSVIVEVRDTGQGITPDVLPHIFEPFFTTKEAGKGTGLGLSITHDIIVMHGGTIKVESVAGDATVFTVCLPIVNSSPAKE